jgi:hypothetical protein
MLKSVSSNQAIVMMSCLSRDLSPTDDAFSHESDSNHQKSAENSRQISNLFKDATKPAVSVCSE